MPRCSLLGPGARLTEVMAPVGGEGEGGGGEGEGGGGEGKGGGEGEGGVGGDGGSGGAAASHSYTPMATRGPQSVQSVPGGHAAKSEPSPPSSQC